MNLIAVAGSDPERVDSETVALENITKKPQRPFILSPQRAQENLLHLSVAFGKRGWLVHAACQDHSDRVADSPLRAAGSLESSNFGGTSMESSRNKEVGGDPRRVDNDGTVLLRVVCIQDQVQQLPVIE